MPPAIEVIFVAHTDGETWWRHQMETFSALLALCAGNAPVTGEFPAQRPVTVRLCCALLWLYIDWFSISIRLTSLALWQSNDCPSASKATLMNTDKYFIWIHYEQLHNHNKAKHNKTVCIFLGIYCSYNNGGKLWYSPNESKKGLKPPFICKMNCWNRLPDIKLTHKGHSMMTSSNGSIFRVTGLLCGEFTGHRWTPSTKASDAGLWCFLWSSRE